MVFQPQGLLGLQAILCPYQQYEILRDGADFIQKHIFPGSLLMSNGRIAEAVKALGFDEVFIRKWNYYLCYCETVFGARPITVAQMVSTRPGNLALESRAYDISGG